MSEVKIATEMTNDEQHVMGLIDLVAGTVHHVTKSMREFFNPNEIMPNWYEAPMEMVQASGSMVAYIIENPGITAEQIHQTWVDGMAKEGWVTGDETDDSTKTHKNMVPFADLPQDTRLMYKVYLDTVTFMVNNFGLKATVNESPATQN